MAAADERAYWIAQHARLFGCSMADVRAMTLRDVGAMTRVLREEAAQKERMRQAQAARRSGRGRRR